MISNTRGFDSVFHIIGNLAKLNNCLKSVIEQEPQISVLKISKMFLNGEKAIYKERFNFLSAKFPVQQMHSGLQKIDCATTFSEVLELCFENKIFHVFSHNDKHEEKIMSSMPVTYNVTKNIIIGPTICACNIFIPQASQYFFVDILFYDEEQHEYPSVIEKKISELPSVFQHEQKNYVIKAFIGFRKPILQRINAMGHFYAAIKSEDSSWHIWDDLKVSSYPAEKDEKICPVAPFVCST